MTSERNIKIVKNCLGIWIIPEICYSLSLSLSHILTANLTLYRRARTGG